MRSCAFGPLKILFVLEPADRGGVSAGDRSGQLGEGEGGAGGPAGHPHPPAPGEGATAAGGAQHSRQGAGGEG